MNESKVNSNGTNVAIKYHILSDEKMRALGFWDGWNHEFTYWFRGVCVLKNPTRYSTYDLKRIQKNPNYVPCHKDLSFCVRVPKNGTDDLDINIIDDDWGQPYDWQRYLRKDTIPFTALDCKEFVEKQMDLLQDAGVLEGHKYGEYI